MKYFLRLMLILAVFSSLRAQTIGDYIDVDDPELAKFRISTLQLTDKFVDHQTLKEWYHNMVELNKYVYAKITDYETYDTSTKNRLTLMIANTLVGYWITRTGYNTMHEGAHAEAVIDFGGDPEYINYWAGDKKVKTIGELFINLLPTTARAAVSYYLPEKTPVEQAVVSAAGVNAQTEFARDRALESIYEGHFHHTETVHYLMNKVINAVYYYYDPDSSSSDINSYVTSLRDQGMIYDEEVEETKSFIAHASILTTLLSGRTWEGINAFSNELLDSKSHSETLGFNTGVGKITWPELNVFLNKDNISVKTDTFLLNENFVFGLSYETSVKGFGENEYSASVLYKHNRWSARFEGIYNDRGTTGYQFDGKYHFNEHFSVFGRARIDDGTLSGRRLFLNSNTELDLGTPTKDFELNTQFYIGVEGRF